nr:D-alanyl-D-alanine carboxypeptidase family protein [uncultured Faecalibacillus sp.]
MRYPINENSITKVGYEPWHYRYVGKVHAKKINELGICLEEYVKMNK